MAIKLVGSVLVLVGAAALGALFATGVKEQEEWLGEIKLVLVLLGGELSYNRTPLPEAFSMVAQRHKGRLTAFLERMGEGLSGKQGECFRTIWERESERLLVPSPLSRQQKRDFLLLGECFERTDDKARENGIDFYLSCLEAELQALKKNGKDKAYLYRMLGMLGGIFLVVLML